MLEYARWKYIPMITAPISSSEGNGLGPDAGAAGAAQAVGINAFI
jgi:hypothetical protein